ncbi:hypothetical protein BIZ92_12715 [Achromobacter xylosoxidans]|uniref:Uncharacterized protein n=1 Tax=Alcaligenes xylosoxydans xylosoxydans TaxID=85698 RepID=A0A1R1JNL9_ALCXX|nr:hypothetical protein BIZ92_12715 [Achromobacter xylosoxidans]
MQAQSEVGAGDRLGAAGTVMRPAAGLVDQNRQLPADACDGEKPRRGDTGRCVRVGLGGLGGRRAAGSDNVAAFAIFRLSLALFLIECALGVKLQELLNGMGNNLVQAGEVDSGTDHRDLRPHRKRGGDRERCANGGPAEPTSPFGFREIQHRWFL